MELVLGIILLIAALFLIIAVLMQHGKQKGLSGTIAGGAETFFGKEKGKSIDKILSKATTVVAIIFVVAVIAVYVIQDTSSDNLGGLNSGSVVPNLEETTASVETTVPAETTEAPVDTTEAPADTAEAPADTTEAPVDTTEAPVEE